MCGERFFKALVVVDLDGSRVLLDGGKLLVEALPREQVSPLLLNGAETFSERTPDYERLLISDLGCSTRRGDDGYRIPTPAEDDWERLRNGINPKPGDAHRLYSEVLASFWQPQPTHTLFETKTFKAGLAIHGREVVAGDMMFQVHLAEDGKDFQSLGTELRTRSQQERKSVFWAIALNQTIDRETIELFRSKEMLARKERETKGEDKVASQAHAHNSLAVNDAAKLGDGRSKSSVAGIALGAKLRNRQALLLPDLAPLKRRRETSPRSAPSSGQGASIPTPSVSSTCCAWSTKSKTSRGTSDSTPGE